MYLPAQFEETRIDVMHELMRTQPLATVVTLSQNGLEANHIPLHLVQGPSAFGTLRGHVARANPIWKDVEPETDVLAVFHGPDAYITPSWYATKQETGKVVPTWNYAVVHAYGRLRAVDDPVWIRSQLEALTVHHESAFSKSWAVSDAPHEFTEGLIRAVVGIEIVITRLIGKWKVSQNQPSQNQASVIDGLASSGTREGKQIAELVNKRMNKAR